MSAPSRPNQIRRWLLQEQDHRLVLDSGLGSAPAVWLGLILVLAIAAIGAAFYWWSRTDQLWPLIAAALASAIGAWTIWRLSAKGRRWVFDLDARRLHDGKLDIAFEDIVAVVLFAAGGKPARPSPARPQALRLGLVVRSPHSDLAERVLRSTRESQPGADPAGLADLGPRLRAESLQVSRSASQVMLFGAAEHLARALDLALIDLQEPTRILSARDLRQPLTARLARQAAEPAELDPPPAGLREESSAEGLTLHFRLPRKQPTVSLVVNLGLLGVLLAVFFLVPGGNSDKDFQWGQAWPLLVAVMFVLPALIRGIWSKNRLEASATRLRVVQRFFSERSQEMETDQLRWLLVDTVGGTGLVVLGDPQPLVIPMPTDSAEWVKRRLERFLTGS